MKNYFLLPLFFCLAISCSSEDSSSPENSALEENATESSTKNDKTRQYRDNETPIEPTAPKIIPKEPIRTSGTEPTLVEKEPDVFRDESVRKDVANVFWSRDFTLFDLITDEPIFPITQNGVSIYKIYYSSNEDPSVHYGEFTEEQLERHLFYKFKNVESCMEFCNSKSR